MQTNHLDSFLKKYNDCVIGWCGNGDYGTAYHTKNNLIIKETTDNEEYFLATLLIGEENNYIVNILDTEILQNGSLIILMETVETPSYIEDLWNEIEFKRNCYDTPLYQLDIDEFNEALSQDAECMLGDISAAVYEFQEKTGFNPIDIKWDNIGIKSESGNFCLIDQRDVCKNDIRFIKMFNQKEMEYV